MALFFQIMRVDVIWLMLNLWLKNRGSRTILKSFESNVKNGIDIKIYFSLKIPQISYKEPFTVLLPVSHFRSLKTVKQLKDIKELAVAWNKRKNWELKTETSE